MRRMIALLFTVVLIVLSACSLAAHYTYILPQDFRVSTGDTVIIGFHSGDGFPESTAILKRLQEPTVRSERGVVRVDGIREDGKRLAAEVTVPASGHLIVTAVNAAAIGTMKPPSFEQYLNEEG